MNSLDIRTVSQDPAGTGCPEQPWPPSLTIHLMTLLSMGLAPSEAVRSLIHGTKLENGECLITVAPTPTKPTGHPEGWWGRLGQRTPHVTHHDGLGQDGLGSPEGSQGESQSPLHVSHCS